jgi:hypothetical protein
MYIYLDTMLWNRLCDEDVDPGRLNTSLAAGQTKLVMSPHAGFELAKTFINAPERGRKLFAYLVNFVKADIPCTKEISGILEAEMVALRSPELAVVPFLPPEFYGGFRKDIEMLAAGNFEDRAKEFVNSRTSLGSAARTGPAQYLQESIAQRLRKITPENLRGWLDSECVSDQGVVLLAEQITRQFTGAPTAEALTWAAPLLASGTGRLAKGLVRADLYFNWRWANRGAIPRDLYHDMYHVLLATYCDVYATKEPKQMEYAGLLLTARTTPALYDGQCPLSGWLEALAQR